MIDMSNNRKIAYVTKSLHEHIVPHLASDSKELWILQHSKQAHLIQFDSVRFEKICYNIKTMKKFHYFLFVLIIGVFVAIIYANQQQNGNTTNATQTPTIPPDGQTMNFNMQQQGQGGQQPQQQGQGQAQGQQSGAQPTFGVEEGVKATYSAVIKTSKGDIEATLYGKEAPNTVKNFVDKSKSGYYKNLTFHRVEDWVVQGGDPKGDGTGGGLMRTELNTQPFVPGSLGIARGADIRVSNDSQFFITKSEASHLDQQYTNFGMVTKGMDVVNKMQIGDKILSITVN